MRIKSGQGNVSIAKVVTVTRAPKVFKLDKGKLGIDMPKLKQGWIGKRVQGGHAPVPYRQQCGNFGRANKVARVAQAGVWAD